MRTNSRHRGQSHPVSGGFHVNSNRNFTDAAWLRHLGSGAKAGSFHSANRSFTDWNRGTGRHAAGKSAYGCDSSEHDSADEPAEHATEYATHESGCRHDAKRNAESEQDAEHNAVDESDFAEQSERGSVHRDQWKRIAEWNPQFGFDESQHGRFRVESHESESGINSGKSCFQ